MLFIDAILRLVFNVTLITGKTILFFIEAIYSFLPLKSTIFGLWMVISLITNVLWILRNNRESYLLAPMSNLIMLNIFVIVTVMEAEWLSSINVEFPGGDVFCKFIKWAQVGGSMMASGLINFIVIVFHYPQTFRRYIMEGSLLIWAFTLLLTLPQVRFK